MKTKREREKAREEKKNRDFSILCFNLPNASTMSELVQTDQNQKFKMCL